jgi:hypothetical protein
MPNTIAAQRGGRLRLREPRIEGPRISTPRYRDTRARARVELHRLDWAGELDDLRAARAGG